MGRSTRTFGGDEAMLFREPEWQGAPSGKRSVSGGSKSDMQQPVTPSSTTLRSVMERMSPTMFVDEKALTRPDVEVRKTPFGVVRIASGTQTTAVDEGVDVRPYEKQSGTDDSKQTEHPTVETVGPPRSSSVNTWGLQCVRQRTKQGRAEVTEEGFLTYSDRRLGATIAITADGQHAWLFDKAGKRCSERESIRHLSSLGLYLYDKAARWLAQHRRRMTVIKFTLPCQSRACPAVCRIRANGPQPDYEVRIPASHDPSHALFVAVHISRERRKATISAVSSDEKVGRAPWHWRFSTLGIGPIGPGGSTAWDLDSPDSKTALLFSRPEHEALHVALSIMPDVDAVFTAVSTHYARECACA